MAVAHDADSNVAAGTGTLSWTHTPTGTPAGVVVFVTYESTSDEVTGVTYGGVALTRFGIRSNGATGATVVGYFLGNSLPTGAQTVSVTVNATGTSKRAAASTVTANTNTQTNIVETFSDGIGGVSESFSAAGAAEVGYGCAGSNGGTFAPQDTEYFAYTASIDVFSYQWCGASNAVNWTATGGFGSNGVGATIQEVPVPNAFPPPLSQPHNYFVFQAKQNYFSLDPQRVDTTRGPIFYSATAPPRNRYPSQHFNFLTPGTAPAVTRYFYTVQTTPNRTIPLQRTSILPFLTPPAPTGNQPAQIITTRFSLPTQARLSTIYIPITPPTPSGTDQWPIWPTAYSTAGSSTSEWPFYIIDTTNSC